MADLKNPNQLLDALSLPVGDLIAEVGKGVAEAQQALDAQVIENFKRIYADDDEALKHLRELGYRPTWYHIPEAEAELKIALSVSGNYSSEGKSKTRMYAAPVDATYKSNFDYSLEGTSSLKFRVVPIPEPARLEAKAVVPNLIGSTLAEAETTLKTLNIPYEVSPENSSADAQVTKVEPDAGTMIDADQTVMLTV